MRCPSLADLPPPPPDRSGWPWTEQSDRPPDAPQVGSPWPRVSIVTPSYNQGRYLEETIRSVLLQGYPSLEYILIDGGSDDESVKIIRKYAQFFRHWCSEPDRGQYHAINKGLAHCTGDIFNWINSDDLYYPGAIVAIARQWLSHPGKIVAGPVVDFHPDGTEATFVPADITLRRLILPADTGRRDTVFHQPGTFLPLETVKNVGGLRDEFDLISDKILLIEVLHRCGITYVDKPLTRFRLHESSKTVSMGYARFTQEFTEALQTLSGFDDILPPAKLTALRARAALLCAGVDVRNRDLTAAASNVLAAFRISIPATLIHISKRLALLFHKPRPQRPGRAKSVEREQKTG